MIWPSWCHLSFFFTLWSNKKKLCNVMTQSKVRRPSIVYQNCRVTNHRQFLLSKNSLLSLGHHWFLYTPTAPLCYLSPCLVWSGHYDVLVIVFIRMFSKTDIGRIIFEKNNINKELHKPYIYSLPSSIGRGNVK